MKYHRVIFKKDEAGQCVFTDVIEQDVSDEDFQKMNWEKPIIRHEVADHTHFLALDDSKQKKLFKINKKINGRLNLSSEKIYSSYNLVKSFESRIKFNNGNILLEQFLLNLGKLGAADILGTISNDKKFTNLKYESNVFVDNEKKFLSKFGVYNKKNISSNFFISGNFDLSNIKNSFYEISHKKKLTAQDVNYVEKEFNEFLLNDGYKNLFRFPKFVEFIKSVTSDIN